MPSRDGYFDDLLHCCEALKIPLIYPTPRNPTPPVPCAVPPSHAS